MKVSTINQFFGKIGRLQIQQRVPILCVFIILTLFCCLGLTKFEIQNSSEGWYGESDILKQNKDTYEAIFGNRNNAAVLVVADDDTIHLTTHLKLGLEKYGTYKGAMEASLREIGKSMFMSTLILCSIYAVYLLSPIRYFFVIGILSILGLSGALIADYTITPVLLYLVKPFGKERSN